MPAQCSAPVSIVPCPPINCLGKFREALIHSRLGFFTAFLSPFNSLQSQLLAPPPSGFGSLASAVLVYRQAIARLEGTKNPVQTDFVEW
jgi:hypothetical protein